MCIDLVMKPHGGAKPESTPSVAPGAFGPRHIRFGRSLKPRTANSRWPREQRPRIQPPFRGCPKPAEIGKVEDGRGGCALRSLLRFPSPLIKPDVQISRIRLSDWPSPYDPRRASIARAHKMQNRKFSKHLAKGEP